MLGLKLIHNFGSLQLFVHSENTRVFGPKLPYPASRLTSIAIEAYVNKYI